ncbi:MAG: CBS domain-containing protein [Chitinophagales bacterium]
MKRREPVSHIMTKQVIFINTTQTLKDAKDIMDQRHIRHVPVVSGDKVVGIISKTDLQRLTVGTFYSNQQDADNAMLDMFTLQDIMVKDPVVISSDTSIREVAELFAASEFHAVPVVDNDVLVGMVSTTDVLKFLIEMY